MKKLILLLVVLLIIGGGVGTAVMMGLLDGVLGGLLGPPSEEEMVEQAEPVDDPVFFEMKRFTVPVIRGSGVAKTFVLAVTLEVRDRDALETVEYLRPKLRAEFLRVLQRYLSTVPVDKQVDLRTIKVLLRKTANRVLGEGTVVAVLAQDTLG